MPRVVRIAALCVTFIGGSSVAYSSALGSDLGAEMAEHPQLTEREYRLVAEQNKKRAEERRQTRHARLADLRQKLASATERGASADVAMLEGVLARLERSPLPRDEEARWSEAHARKMMLHGWSSKFGTRLQAPEVNAEFERHAWRMARLQRALDVTAYVTDVERRSRITAKVRALEATESERHRAVLTQLLGEWNGATTSLVAPSEQATETRAPEAAGGAADKEPNP